MMVAAYDNSATQVATPIIYGERTNSGIAANALPPMFSVAAFGPVCTTAALSSRYTQNTATSRNTAAAIIRFTGPNGTESQIVMTGPNNAPAVPPAPINPKSRLPCSDVNRSAMNDQKTATANRLNTLTHTKNMRATCTVSISKVSNTQNNRRLATKK